MKRLAKYLAPLCVLLTCAASAQSSGYDGHWWSLLSEGEKEEFVAGASDCSIYDAQLPQYLSGSLADAAEKVSGYYKANPAHAKSTVLSAIRALSNTIVTRAYEAHGSLDGNYWRQSDGLRRIAFVRGYLACRETYLHSRIAKPVEFYVQEVSAWYKVSDTDKNALSAKTGGDKVGDVLVRLIGK